MKLTFDTHGNEKQKDAARAWLNPAIRDLGYGGGKAGGKSYTGGHLIFGDAFIYPDTRYFIARKSLNDLRKWTAGTIEKIFKQWRISSKTWDFNGQDNYYHLSNESRVYFLEAAELPSDPDYTRFGSREFTRGWIEEEGEIAEAAAQNISATVGRWNNDLYNLVPKVLHTFNPSKNHLYRRYYKPSKENAMPGHRVFINALPSDNKMLPAEYIEQLKNSLSYNQQQRLLYGNWEYDDDPAVMCDWNAITDSFTNEVNITSDKKRIAADLAMKGRDRFVAGLFHGGATGMTVKVVVDKLKATGKEIEMDLRAEMSKNSVGHSDTIVDSDGMGGYLESYLEGIKEFHGGSAAISKEYWHIKDELGYKLAEMINKRLIKIICTSEQRERIEMQLSALKADDIDADTKKKRIVAKDVMKEQLGCSPDYLDMLLMGMYWEVLSEPVNYVDRS